MTKLVPISLICSLLVWLTPNEVKCQGVFNSSAAVFSTGTTGNINHLLPLDAVPSDTKVTITVESAPLESHPTVSHLMPQDRGDHWQIVIRDAESKEPIQGLGWGKIDDKKLSNFPFVYEGKLYEDSRWNEFQIARDSVTGAPYPVLNTHYGAAVEVLNSASDQWRDHYYHWLNDANPAGAFFGSKGYSKSTQFNGSPADNCQQFARFAFSEADKRLDVVKTVVQQKTGLVNLDNVGDFQSVSPIETHPVGNNLVENEEPPPLNKDVLHSLANLFETGEELVEVREDMREDRRERKAKEQAEREKRAAEEAAEAERLRQQRLAEQRERDQRRQSEKKSDKKSDKTTSKQTEKSTETSPPKSAQKTATPTQTKKTQPTTTQPSKNASASFDMSKMTSIYEKRMAVLKEIYALPEGETASAAQRQQVNSYLTEYKAELARLEKLIDNGPKNNTWYNYGLELNIKSDAQMTLMSRMVQRCKNAGKL